MTPTLTPRRPPHKGALFQYVKPIHFSPDRCGQIPLFPIVPEQLFEPALIFGAFRPVFQIRLID